MPNAFMTILSNTGSLLPLRILRMKGQLGAGGDDQVVVIGLPRRRANRYISPSPRSGRAVIAGSGDAGQVAVRPAACQPKVQLDRLL